MPEEQITRHINENPDSIEWGTPSRGGARKVHHRADDPVGFQAKIDAMNALRTEPEAQKE